ncbi:hypothetical protein C8Q79DRAFT_540578 [Trametes meyenii]|nr:hypothetical protein C8Q79DRAFT_540578 [Trametes meyenii]
MRMTQLCEPVNAVRLLACRQDGCVQRSQSDPKKSAGESMLHGVQWRKAEQDKLPRKVGWQCLASSAARGSAADSTPAPFFLLHITSPRIDISDDTGNPPKILGVALRYCGPLTQKDLVRLRDYSWRVKAIEANFLTRHARIQACSDTVHHALASVFDATPDELLVPNLTHFIRRNLDAGDIMPGSKYLLRFRPRPLRPEIALLLYRRRLSRRAFTAILRNRTRQTVGKIPGLRFILHFILPLEHRAVGCCRTWFLAQSVGSATSAR